MSDDYYVYVYVDPRNFEEFYFGKGKGSRKDAHLTDSSDSAKTQRIAAIHADGEEPIVRVIARGLSEHDAFLVEKTLLWKLGRQLTNVSSGQYADKFRPRDSFHRLLSGFDYERGIYYYNVGDGDHRNWDDFHKFGFISAGQGERWRDAMLGFQQGDVVAAYLKGAGFVGIGVVTKPACPIRRAIVGGMPVLSLPLQQPRMADNVESDEKCEYVAMVDWKASVGRDQAKWTAKAGIFTTTHVRASLDGQPRTISFLEQAFDLNIRELVA